MLPGEIYYAEVPGVGRRPVIVVSRETLNRGNKVVAVLVTSQRFATRSQFANCVPFRAGEFGFTTDCVAQGETVQPIEMQDIDPDLIDVLDDEKLREVIRAVGDVMDADCEPV